MIPLKEKTVEVESNITGTTGQFSVDESALGHIMDVLTNLYSDPERAVAREYITNAFDAQVEAGMVPGTDSWIPIQVSTPSHFSKAYKIRDFGVGMDGDDLVNTYSKYGKSTKTKSNDVVGMLGLGSKCALTYTNSFSIIGFKNGVKTTAIISKNDENIPVFHIVGTEKTSEPNGVEISVPVKDRNAFANKTREFLRWWQSGIIVVDGHEPEHHNLSLVHEPEITFRTVEYVNGEARYADAKAKAQVYLVEGGTNWSHAQSRVVMGNVAYDVGIDHVSDVLRGNGMGFVAYVPMGAVNFPPNRETLNYNKVTKSTLDQIGEGLFEHVQQTKFDEVTNAADYKEAYAKWLAVPNAFKRGTKWEALTYKGDKFLTRLEHRHMQLDWDWQGYGQISDRQQVHLPTAIPNAIVVTGVPQGQKPSSYFKKKVRHWIREINKSDHTEALLVDKDIDTIWLRHAPRIDADTIKAIKLPKNTTNGVPRVEAGYDFYVKDAKGYNGVKTDTSLIVVPKKGGEICYISPADMRETRYKSGTRVEALMKYLPDNITVVVLGTNRFEKFLRTHPNARKLKDVWKEVIEDHVKNTSDVDYLVKNLDYSEREFLSHVDHKALDDPDLTELAKVVQGVTKTDDRWETANNMCALGRRAEISVSLPERKVKGVNVAKRYPLIEFMGRRQMKHMLIYINAVYASEHAPKKP